MRDRPSFVTIIAMSLMIAGANARADCLVSYTIDSLGADLFQYNLTIHNSGLPEPISGLNILHGNSVFGLDATSTIGGPLDVGGNPVADWAFFAPDPPFVDDLDYFSLDVAGDVPIGGSLAGFFFQSTRNPATLSGGDFSIELIGGLTFSQIDGGNACIVPEPSTLVLLCIGALALKALRRTVLHD